MTERVITRSFAYLGISIKPSEFRTVRKRRVDAYPHSKEIVISSWFGSPPFSEFFFTYKQVEGCRWCEMTKWCDIFVYNVQSQQVWVLWLWQTWFLNRVHHMSFPEILLPLSLWHTVKSGPSFLWGFGGPFEAWSSEYHQDLRGQKHGSAKRDPSYCKGSWLGYNILYRRSISNPFWWFSHLLRGILEQRLTSLGYLICVSIDKLTIELKRPEACGESSMSSRQIEENTWRNRTMQVLQLCDDYASI